VTSRPRNPMPAYDAETTAFIAQKTFENCCHFNKYVLRKIFKGEPTQHLLNNPQRRNMREIGILIPHTPGFRPKIGLTERAKEFLGFSKKEHENMTKTTPPGAQQTRPRGRKGPIQRNTRHGGIK